MTPRPERPNTVSGLNAKRDELVKYRASLEAEIRKVTCDIDHIEAAVRLFNPDTALVAFKAYIVHHRARKGTVTRFILNMLREAPHPLQASRSRMLGLPTVAFVVTIQQRS